MDDDLRRALRLAPPEQDHVSAPVEAAIEAARQRRRRLHWLPAFAVVAATGVVLFLGYEFARTVLPPLGGDLSASALWIPFGAAAVVVVAVASVALMAIGRRG